MFFKSVMFIICFASAINASAAKNPNETRKDPRIKEVRYSPDDVVELKTHYFRETMIQFADHESVVSHRLGDPTAWTIEKESERPNLLFIKPSEDMPDTNLTVITDKRIYLFKIIGQLKKDKVSSGDTSTYALRFIYPKEKTLAMERKAEAIAQLENQTIIPGHTIDPGKMNHNYGFKGSEGLKPVQVFDDGTFTYFQFAKNQAIPAIFFVDDIVGGADREQLVNYHHRGSYIVVERVGVQFALRIDQQVTCVFNRSLYKKS